MPTDRSPVELWGGVECTVNRVGDVFHDQYVWSGHRERIEADLEAFATLGLRTLRTGLQWEYFDHSKSWEFADRNLTAMNRIGLRPIVGLVHHGSGPANTNLLDPEFGEKLAAYALKFAQRFPWVVDYTPINEPQTTGRFACLYRHWYPHHCSMRSYVRALLNQIKGIALSMEAIRSVQPAARLIHTEDGGRTFSTPQLESYRVEREHRRWLGLDLLCGRVTRDHPLFEFLLTQGAAESEILWFAERSCPPDIIGLNYYVTSDRFLDHRTDLYPSHFTGGDTGTEPLVDVEAVRFRAEGITQPEAVLTECWARYRRPVAITEAHLGCFGHEQMRWLAEVWRGAEQARDCGVDVRGVTCWGLLGLYNWCHLCTHDARDYESGVFDVSSGIPTATALTSLVRELANGHIPQDEVLTCPGWWRQESRLTLPGPRDDCAKTQSGEW